jgi:hypothetical protein
MHPIHYSFLLNIAALIIAGLLSWQQGQPLWLIVAVLLQNHSLARFTNLSDDQDESDSSPKIGFHADID